MILTVFSMCRLLLMPKKKRLTHEQKLINTLRKIPNPIEDKRHGIFIRFVDNKIRSNETRFEHIVLARHELKPNDFKRIVTHIKTATFRQDSDRKETFNIYVKRNNYNDEYIKISLKIKKDNPREAIVKTIFITKNIK